jgi:murein DD-endopeptidase MepM/ murein hydrolase activator NlpD
MTTAVAYLLSLLLTTTIPLVEIPTTETSHTGVWPLHPRPAVAAGFDPPLTTYGAGHRGVDLVGSPGQEVRAAVGGRITYAGSLAGRGVVVVSHGSTRTTYEPVSAAVRPGAVLTAGEVIGTLQEFGSHCSPRACLHWGLIEGETYLDPLTLVGSGPVRLLPLFEPSDVVSRPTSGLDVSRRMVTHVGVPGGTPAADGRW